MKDRRRQRIRKDEGRRRREEERGAWTRHLNRDVNERTISFHSPPLLTTSHFLCHPARPRRTPARALYLPPQRPAARARIRHTACDGAWKNIDLISNSTFERVWWTNDYRTKIVCVLHADVNAEPRDKRIRAATSLRKRDTVNAAYVDLPIRRPVALAYIPRYRAPAARNAARHDWA